jgi:P-type Cu+ transporter
MEPHPHGHSGDPHAATVKDPVCGMDVDPAKTPHHAQHDGRSYHFCSGRCREKFVAEPGRYLGSGARPQVHADAREYTCPMHPQVRQQGPGSCPICGMALEPVVVTADEGENHELADMRRRFWVSAALSLPLVGVAMAEMAPATPLHGAAWLPWVELALATPVVAWGGWPFFVRGWQSVMNRSPNMFTLIAMGIGVAFGFSVVATVAPGLFPDGFRDMGTVPVYFEASAMITTLVLLGQVLELRARSRAGAAIKALLGLAPKTARRIAADGSEADAPLEHVGAGGTGSSWRERAMSTSRCSPASPFRSRRGSAMR